MIITKSTERMTFERGVVSIALSNVLNEILPAVTLSLVRKEVQMFNTQIAVEETMVPPNVIAQDFEAFVFRMAKWAKIPQQFLRFPTDPIGLHGIVNSAISCFIDRGKTSLIDRRTSLRQIRDEIDLKRTFKPSVSPSTEREVNPC